MDTKNLRECLEKLNLVWRMFEDFILINNNFNDPCDPLTLSTYWDSQWIKQEQGGKIKRILMLLIFTPEI